MVPIRGIQISKSYDHYQVLKEVSFEVAEGECYALFGPNGAGKTTLLKILATVHRPSSGRFEIMGYDGIREKMNVREALLLVSHCSYIYEELNVVENLRFAAGLRGLSPTDREMKIALDTVGIGAFASLRSRYLSAGMRKRLSIARALLIRPKVLLLDEAYSALDERGMDILTACLKGFIQQGTAVLITTHSRASIAEVADRVGILHRGELREMAVKDLMAADELF